MPSVSQDGQTTDPSGQDRAPANLSQRQESKKAKRTSDTSGRNSIDSSVPDGPLSSWENRLRQRLESIGSTEFLMTWKGQATPAGRSLSRHVPSTRPIEEIVFGSWPTPTRMDANSSRRHGYMIKGNPGTTLTDAADMHVATWATPMAHEARLGYQRRMGDAKGTQKSLTTEAVDALGLGENITGIRVQTEKRAALNPAFPCWLMGFPPEWDDCAPTETRSSRKSRRKS